MEDGILNKVFVNKDLLTEDEKKGLDEMQLWWDKELSELNDEEKKFSRVKSVISGVLKTGIKQILKSSKSSTELKQKLLE
jgi:hypothetical protein